MVSAEALTYAIVVAALDGAGAEQVIDSCGRPLQSAALDRPELGEMSCMPTTTSRAHFARWGAKEMSCFTAMALFVSLAFITMVKSSATVLTDIIAKRASEWRKDSTALSGTPRVITSSTQAPTKGPKSTEGMASHVAQPQRRNGVHHLHGVLVDVQSCR